MTESSTPLPPDRARTTVSNSRGEVVDLSRVADDLAAWARAQGTAGATQFTDLPKVLEGMFEKIRRGGASLPVAVGWIGAVASAPGPFQFGTLLGTLSGGTAHAVAERAHWLSFLDAMGPLSWAAGMPLEEALVQHAAGALHEPELRTLAALRGWHYPPSGLLLS